MTLDSYQKRYSDRLTDLLLQNPEAFRTLAERYQDRRAKFNRPDQLRDFIEANYDVSGFDLFDHLPDTVDSSYIFEVFGNVYARLGDNTKTVVDPSFNWVNHPALNKSFIAGKMGMSPQTFDKKLKGIGANKFSIEEIVWLSHVREMIIEDLRPSIIPS